MTPQEERNLASAKEMIKYVTAGDYEAVAKSHTPDCVWRIGYGAAADIIPFFGEFHGHEGIFQCVGAVPTSHFEPTGWEIDRMFASGDRVFMFGTASYRMKPTGEEFTTLQAYESVINEDGLATEMTRMVDTAVYYAMQQKCDALAG